MVHCLDASNNPLVYVSGVCTVTSLEWTYFYNRLKAAARYKWNWTNFANPVSKLHSQAHEASYFAWSWVEAAVVFCQISKDFCRISRSLEGFLTFGQASMGLILNNYAATDGLILKFFELIFFFWLVAIIFVSSAFLAGRDHKITELPILVRIKQCKFIVCLRA